MNGLEKSRAALSARAEKLFRQTSRVGYDACAATSLRMISWSWWGKWPIDSFAASTDRPCSRPGPPTEIRFWFSPEPRCRLAPPLVEPETRKALRWTQ